MGDASDRPAVWRTRNGALAGAKYRSIEDKDFTQDAGGTHDFFGIDLVDTAKPLIIVEGEIDALTAMEAGIENCVSVPSGAPLKVADGKVLASEDKRFSYVWNAIDIINKVPYIVIATDNDTPGQALAEELARRIGKEKCRLTKFAEKDLNEAFANGGAERVKQIIDLAEPYPVEGLSDAAKFQERLNDLWTRGNGSGASTGFTSLDRIYTVVPGQLTVVTGYPSHGKSNFVDQLMVNLARQHDWKFTVCSFENQPEIHISRFMEIYENKRFFEGSARMSEMERDRAFKWVQDHFLFMDSETVEPATIDSILSRAKAAAMTWRTTCGFSPCARTRASASAGRARAATALNSSRKSSIWIALSHERPVSRQSRVAPWPPPVEKSTSAPMMDICIASRPTPENSSGNSRGVFIGIQAVPPASCPRRSASSTARACRSRHAWCRWGSPAGSPFHSRRCGRRNDPSRGRI